MPIPPADAEILRQVLALPTSPFHEAHVARFVEAFARERDLPCKRDRFGNLYVSYHHGQPRSQPIVLEAHMDHPGFHVESVKDGRARLAFLGKGPSIDLTGEPLLVYNDTNPTEARSATIVSCTQADGFYRPLFAEAEVDPGVQVGDFATFDLTTWQLRNHRLHARAHDDLAQVAATLCTLDRLARQRDEAHVIGLFTRAEEVGFIGAYGATEDDHLPENAVIICLECSGMPRSRGFVVRSGDLTTTYNHWATTRLLQLADAEAKQRDDFLFQTPLPRRGTCNASLYVARNRIATGLTLPLENYHNWGPDRVRAEVIDARDWASLVHFLHVIGTQFGPYENIQHAVQQHMDRLWQSERGNL
ncbi:hypothetical protein ACERK3_06380 [Phycisphaerales bacterium AB-hyl4]|uniref:Uncharacterized protein n=1 Tax=Natronomicrosphaera hydrolytica TaxID=3242702 RepID=A0ABV4U3N1_9BACT